MPAYEYECLACKHRFERNQHMTDPPIDHCPECEGTVRKVFQAFGMAVRGEGGMTTPPCATGGCPFTRN